MDFSRFPLEWIDSKKAHKKYHPKGTVRNFWEATLTCNFGKLLLGAFLEQLWKPALGLWRAALAKLQGPALECRFRE